MEVASLGLTSGDEGITREGEYLVAVINGQGYRVHVGACGDWASAEVLLRSSLKNLPPLPPPLNGKVVPCTVDSEGNLFALPVDKSGVYHCSVNTPVVPTISKLRLLAQDYTLVDPSGVETTSSINWDDPAAVLKMPLGRRGEYLLGGKNAHEVFPPATIIVE
jgi:hypothetical protein